ncbi:MAG: transcriptional regulator, partial [Chloroflexi bacterium]|nr:transcriptional regulator [Chloroflexota bacterium]
MTRRWQVRPNTYHDSVKLMRVSEALAGRPGVVRAAAVMATPLNLDLLAGDGLLPPEVQAAPDD